MKLIIRLLCIFVLLSGCSFDAKVQGAKKIAIQEQKAREWAAELMNRAPQTDLFMLNGSIYLLAEEAQASRVKDNGLGTITKIYTPWADFNENMASKLPLETKIFSSDKIDHVVAVVEDQERIYRRVLPSAYSFHHRFRSFHQELSCFLPSASLLSVALLAGPQYSVGSVPSTKASIRLLGQPSLASFPVSGSM